MIHRGYIMIVNLFLLVALTLPGSVGLADTGAGELGAVLQDLDALKSEMETMKKQLGEIQKLLLQRAAQLNPAGRGPVTISVGDGPALGSADAPITIVECSDYQCPFCRKHFTDTFDTLKTGYIETGKVRYFFRDFPLDSIHPYARKAAEAAHCAGEQGKYWEMHNTMFINQCTLKPDNLLAFASDMQLDRDAFNALSRERQVREGG